MTNDNHVQIANELVQQINQALENKSLKPYGAEAYLNDFNQYQSFNVLVILKENTNMSFDNSMENYPMRKVSSTIRKVIRQFQEQNKIQFPEIEIPKRKYRQYRDMRFFDGYDREYISIDFYVN